MSSSAFRSFWVGGLVALLLAPVGAAQISGKVERMAQGFGGSVAVLDSSSFTELGRVTVKAKSEGFCAVTASFSAELDLDDLLKVTLSVTPDAPGSWEQSYENEGDASKTVSGLITQTFDVAKNTVTKFYVNAQVFNGEAVSVELTRIWALCGRGAAQ